MELAGHAAIKVTYSDTYPRSPLFFPIGRRGKIGKIRYVVCFLGCRNGGIGRRARFRF
jgi:hypothetical protein